MSDIDMSQFTAAKSDQLTADDLIGNPRTIVITKVTGNEANKDQPINVFYEGDNGKPFRPCKTVRRIMVNAWGKNASGYAGRSMTLYCDPNVTWGGMKVGGIRISHMSNIGDPLKMALAANNKQRKMHIVKPLQVEAVDHTIHLPALEAAADLGMETLKKAWMSMQKPARDALGSHLDGLKARAEKADAPAEEAPNAEEGRGEGDFGDQNDGFAS